MLEEKTDKRLHILEKAEALFGTHGYEAVSIRKLAAAANVNVAMVNYYFGSKEKLFEAVLENKIPRMREWLDQLAQSDLSPWEKISQTIDNYVDKMFINRDFNRTLMREISLEQRPENVDLIARHITRNMQIIREFIQEGQEKGHFKYVDPELTIASLLGTIAMMINNGRLVSDLVNLEAADLYDAPFMDRLKIHLKSMLQAHLLK